MVGCSGEEFASILKALSFKRERRKLVPDQAKDAAPAATAGAKADAGEGAVPGPVATEANEEAFDEIWRPGRRKETRHAKRTGERDQPRREHPQQAGKRERPRPQAQPKREGPASVEHSPFAALRDLRQTLAARRQERG